jgi:hypothetical protein
MVFDCAAEYVCVCVCAHAHVKVLNINLVVYNINRWCCLCCLHHTNHRTMGASRPTRHTVGYGQCGGQDAWQAIAQVYRVIPVSLEGGTWQVCWWLTGSHGGVAYMGRDRRVSHTCCCCCCCCCCRNSLASRLLSFVCSACRATVKSEFGGLSAINPLFDGKAALAAKYNSALGDAHDIVADMLERTRKVSTHTLRIPDSGTLTHNTQTS